MIINYPNIYKIKIEDKALIWKYRYYLKNNPKALVKFLRSVKWNNDKIRKESLELLNNWEEINYEDSLFLLSSVFSNNNIYEADIYNINEEIKKKIIWEIRNYSIEIIKKTNIEKLNLIILQLIHCLRYEEFVLNNCKLFNYLVEISLDNKNLAINLYWNLEIEKSNHIKEVKKWYYELKTNLFLIYKEKNIEIYQLINKQKKLREEIIKIFNNSVRSKKAKNIYDKRDLFKSNLNKSDFFKKLNFVLMKPELTITKLNVKGCHVFGSNTSPLLFDFILDNNENYKIIYKYGDDMRQDYLILKIVSLMDYWLKNMNIDLRLTIYEILVLSKDDGFMECVPNCKTLQQILGENNNDLKYYFIKISKLNNISLDFIYTNYIESIAAYSVITYILGIGDRHLENLMIDNNGRIFHIDFGYSMGEEPKPFNPPIKLNKEMISCLGGKDGENYKIFVLKCVSYFLYIRKNANLLINLLFIMIHSNLVINPGRNKLLDFESISKMGERFLLNETDTNVEIIFKKIINNSVDAVITGIYDKIHKFISK